MAYVNFKEEVFILKEQLRKRKNNNETLYNRIQSKKIILSGYSKNLKYSNRKNVNKLIGKEGTLHINDFLEIANEDFVCSRFESCRFKNIKFKDCNFIGCVFDDCSFDGGGVIFENCIFTKRDSEKLPALNKEDNLGCSFYNSYIYCKFYNCDISYAIFEECKIDKSNFEYSDMKDIIVYRCEMNEVKIMDCDLCGFKTYKTYITNFDFDDKYNTKFDDKTFFDKIEPRKKDKAEYEGLYMIYKTFANKFKDNNFNSNFGEYYYLAKCMERKTVPIIPKISSYVNWMVCGYGERPWLCVTSSLVIITVFALIYLFTGMKIEGEIIHYDIKNVFEWDIKAFIMHINEAMNLSIGMFAGVGINNANPVGINYMIANLEMLIGIAMVGIGIGTLTRKVIR